jgi:GNAT superfamily N-acetyltransferase
MDMLVKLYDSDLARPATRDAATPFATRRALAAESLMIVSWVKKLFGMGWAGEATAALASTPARCLLALDGQRLLGFACWDVSALGFFGPLGVDPEARRSGIGTALLRDALVAMRAQGYGYAIIGGVADPGFYARAVGAVSIDGSDPGIYEGLLKSGGA